MLSVRLRNLSDTIIFRNRLAISAIGPVDNMKKALDSSQDVTIYRQYVSAFGLGWQVDEKEKLHFDATDALQQPLQYAQAMSDGTGETQ